MRSIAVVIAVSVIAAAPAAAQRRIPFTTPTPAPAPVVPAATVSVGTQVSDANGAPVGTITKIEGDVVTVKTDKVEASLGKASFTPQGGKLLVGITQSELNAMVEKQNAAISASLAVGATVKDSAGASAGSISAIDQETVTLKLPSGKSVRIPRTAIAGSANGAALGVTTASLEAQAK